IIHNFCIQTGGSNRFFFADFRRSRLLGTIFIFTKTKTLNKQNLNRSLNPHFLIQPPASPLPNMRWRRFRKHFFLYFLSSDPRSSKSPLSPELHQMPPALHIVWQALHFFRKSVRSVSGFPDLPYGAWIWQGR